SHSASSSWSDSRALKLVSLSLLQKCHEPVLLSGGRSAHLNVDWHFEFRNEGGDLARACSPDCRRDRFRVGSSGPSPKLECVLGPRSAAGQGQRLLEASATRPTS